MNVATDTVIAMFITIHQIFSTLTWFAAAKLSHINLFVSFFMLCSLSSKRGFCCAILLCCALSFVYVVLICAWNCCLETQRRAAYCCLVLFDLKYFSFFFGNFCLFIITSSVIYATSSVRYYAKIVSNIHTHKKNIEIQNLGQNILFGVCNMHQSQNIRVMIFYCHFRRRWKF